jgi:3-methyladenine DNA glycosylase AlkD
MNAYVRDLEDLLERVGDTHRAAQMAAYMKHNFEFIGVMAQPRRVQFLQWKSMLPKEIDRTQAWQIVHECWERAPREIQYCAIDWLLKWPKKTSQHYDIHELEKLLVNKSWWDSIDPIATHLIANFAIQHPKYFKDVAKEWELSTNFWLHRTLLIHQLKFKKQTNLELLQYYIRTFKWNKEFFIQKAIGWSLREVSKWNADWVCTVVEQEALTGLARREALKYVG